MPHSIQYLKLIKSDWLKNGNNFNPLLEIEIRGEKIRWEEKVYFIVFAFAQKTLVIETEECNTFAKEHKSIDLYIYFSHLIFFSISIFP